MKWQDNSSDILFAAVQESEIPAREIFNRLQDGKAVKLKFAAGKLHKKAVDVVVKRAKRLPNKAAQSDTASDSEEEKDLRELGGRKDKKNTEG